ncbi:hypothetical protein [Dyadobacter alkalitolerans]|uniref:hypothetical protein n=1 Tax=Dyadobacter alkalitolerans TaxID=492736 RepID=UPI00040A9144|nr:hypothetical protein [Dyadobacter alkalitolerans]
MRCVLALLTKEEIEQNRNENDGFLELDYIFENAFKDLFRDKDPEFYERIRELNIEQFVESMMAVREKTEPFKLFRKEYVEAEKSIRNEESIHSKLVPESKGGITYHDTDESGEEKAIYYNTFVDCIGQPHLPFESFPFKSLIADGTVMPAHLKFRSSAEGGAAIADGNENVEQTAREDFYLKVPGIAITDHFQVLERSGSTNRQIYVMAVPYIGGYNPDYSGLDFCEQASLTIVESILKE